MNCLGPFSLYAYAYGITCQDGVSMELTFGEFLQEKKIIIDKLILDCNYFPYYNTIHFTIPKDKQEEIHVTLLPYANQYVLKLKFIQDYSKTPKVFTSGFVYYNNIYSKNYPGY